MPKPRPICGCCRVEMRVMQNEVTVNDPAVGEFPSTYWSGDKYRCPECAAKVVTNFGIGTSSPVDGGQSMEFTR